MQWLEPARDHWSARPDGIEPVRVRVWLSSAVVWNDYHGFTALEGALQTAVIHLETGQSPCDVFAEWPKDKYAWIPTPIAELPSPCNGELIPAISHGHPCPLWLDTKRMRRKQTDVESFPGDGIVNISGGPLKILDTPVSTKATPWVDFYARADVERLNVLLRHISGLGRDAARGSGTILGIEISPDPEDRSVVYHGTPQRAVPVDCIEQAAAVFTDNTYMLQETGIRAPYWHQAIRRLCAVPVP